MTLWPMETAIIACSSAVVDLPVLGPPWTRLKPADAL